MKNILLILVFAIFMISVQAKNNRVIVKMFRDTDGFFDEWKDKISKDDLKECKEQFENVCSYLLFKNEVRLLGIKWPAMTEFITDDHTVYPSKDVKIKDYWAKGSADHKYEVVIFSKDWSNFSVRLSKDHTVTIFDETKVCPADSQLIVKLGKPWTCCIKRECGNYDVTFGFFK